jgi:two-component system response regulator YesN
MIKVLVVDDEKWVRRGIIEKANWKALEAEVVGEARDGQEGLDMSMKLLPDIVITDMKMPKMDGIEFISKLYKELPKTKVVVVSGYSDYEYTRQALLNKAVDYILKPIESSVINKALDRAIAEYKKGINGTRVNNEHENESCASLTSVNAAKGTNEIVKTVKKYIDLHYSENINLNFISKKFFISDTYFCRVFKKQTGQTFLDYLTSLRMEKARNLIENHHVRMYEAASLVGYKDERHFSKLYRKYVSKRAD